jgi:hypothetical protein
MEREAVKAVCFFLRQMIPARQSMGLNFYQKFMKVAQKMMEK